MNKMLDFDFLKENIVNANKMVLFVGISNIAELYNCVFKENLSVESAIKTKCGLHVDCIEYLMGLSNQKNVFDNYYYENNYVFDNFKKEYVYVVCIQGINNSKFNIQCPYTTSIDHQFLLIHYDNNWHLIDSYIGQRGLTKKIIDINKLSEFIQKQRISFDQSQWNEMFNVDIKSDLTSNVYCIINRCQSTKDIKKSYEKLCQSYNFCLESSDHTILDPNLLVLQ
ncbi:putative ORFan [Tupanvirus deep ocean]|uniref:ORFan n=2 Tax=Tupanvirus TaxID=2094720 RepID=A0AC62A7E4_9VIRU|nr:putative ORFan [Tupanvirus deep ocean]QKU33548.1 putative ORFan [Tupanvirus deep ocean]